MWPNCINHAAVSGFCTKRRRYNAHKRCMQAAHDDFFKPATAKGRRARRFGCKEIKQGTTYRRTLAEGSSTPASCHLSKSTSPDLPVGNPGNRRRWGHHPHRIGGLSWCCRVGCQGPHMALNHILIKKKKEIHVSPGYIGYYLFKADRLNEWLIYSFLRD